MKGHPSLEIGHMSLGELREKFDKGEIFVNRDYQRGVIWGKMQKQNLIGSIMDDSPIGVLIVWENRDSKIEILDGQQRIFAIIEFLRNEIEDKNGRKFEGISKTSQDHFTGYNIPFLQVMAAKPSEVSAIFVRLQEGIPLNIAEKVHAFTGSFKDTFTNIFSNNHPFFANYSNKRLRANFLAAQFLALQLRTDFRKPESFPSLYYQDFQKINDEYKTDLPESAANFCDGNVKFIFSSLSKELKSISVRDILSVYLLTSYLRRYQMDDSRLSEQIRNFVVKLKEDLSRFSIYDTKAPRGMRDSRFMVLMKYKNLARQAATEESMKGRFDILLKEYRKMFRIGIRKNPRDASQAIPEPMPKTLAEIKFEDILKSEESTYLEFKSSMLVDVQEKNVPQRTLKREISTTVAAFLNTDGGILVVGVGPKKEIYGIEPDFNTLKEKNWDEWLRVFTDWIDTDIGVGFNQMVEPKLVSYKEKHFAFIKVMKSKKPAYIDPKGEQEFYIRSQNTSKKLKPMDAHGWANSMLR